jgi:2-C-methyl-D-erythritol 4-phosphate cytidylyltransferase|tara:strand:- start:715 stop:963 length:249 start_codon:yes stop_codon:yes gene_type:complete
MGKPFIIGKNFHENHWCYHGTWRLKRCSGKKYSCPLAGRPLIAYTIELGMQCSLITDVVLTTEDEEIHLLANIEDSARQNNQ